VRKEDEQILYEMSGLGEAEAAAVEGVPSTEVAGAVAAPMAAAHTIPLTTAGQPMYSVVGAQMGQYPPQAVPYRPT